MSKNIIFPEPPMRGGGLLLTDGALLPVLPSMSEWQKNNDSIPAVLQPGEIVIPVRHARTVEGFLRKRGIRLPGM